MPILCRVKFHDPIDVPPKNGIKSLPLPGGWAKMPGWSIRVVGTRLEITTDVMELDEAQGIPPDAIDELKANDPEAKGLRLIVSTPLSNCDLIYVDADAADKVAVNKAPTPALLRYYEERKKQAQAAAVSRPPGVPTSAYSGPPLTPASRRMPVGAAPDKPPPPSEIELPNEVEKDSE